MTDYDEFAERMLGVELMTSRWRRTAWKRAAKSFWRLWRQTNEALTWMQERSNQHLDIERSQRRELERQRETINALTSAILELKATLNRTKAL